MTQQLTPAVVAVEPLFDADDPNIIEPATVDRSATTSKRQNDNIRTTTTARPPHMLVVTDGVINPPVRQTIIGDLQSPGTQTTRPRVIAGGGVSNPSDLGINRGVRSSPCSDEPCLNNGTCEPSGDQYTCRCSVAFFGSNCQGRHG